MHLRHSLPARRGALRVVVAAAALYALLLQGFLGALLPAPGSDFAAYCAHADGSAPDPASHAHDGCCLAACRPALALPPSAAATPVERAAIRLAAPILPASSPAAARPDGAPGARGPPAA